jgi:hypothetical protein
MHQRRQVMSRKPKNTYSASYSQGNVAIIQLTVSLRVAIAQAIPYAGEPIY